MGLITGVGYDGLPSYADSPDPEFMSEYGIGPGCAGTKEGTTRCTSDADCADIGTQACGPGGHCVEWQTAIAPLRLAELTNHFAEDNMCSICEDDFAAALAQLATRLADQLVPACHYQCVQDQDLTTPTIVDPECILAEMVGTSQIALVECLSEQGA